MWVEYICTLGNRCLEVCIWNGVCTEGMHECGRIGSCINSRDDTGQEDGGRGRARGRSSCVRLGSISCPCQFHEVARAGKQVAVGSAVGSGNCDATRNLLLLLAVSTTCKTALLALLTHPFFVRWVRPLSDALLKADVKRRGGSEESR